MNESRKKLTECQIGALVKKFREVKKRIDKQSLGYQSTLSELQLLTEGKGWIMVAAQRNGLDFMAPENGVLREMPARNVVDEQLLVYQIFLLQQKTEDLLEQGCLDYEETIRSLQGIIENQGYLMRQVIEGKAKISEPGKIHFNSAPKKIPGYQASFHNFKEPIPFDEKAFKFVTPSEVKNGLSPFLCKLRDYSPNANIFDFLLENENLVPKSWHQRYVCSLGTIYWDEYEDSPYIKALACDPGKMHWELIPLDSDFDEKFSFLIYSDADSQLKE